MRRSTVIKRIGGNKVLAWELGISRYQKTATPYASGGLSPYISFRSLS
jgi:hypothetical protein